MGVGTLNSYAMFCVKSLAYSRAPSHSAFSTSGLETCFLTPSLTLTYFVTLDKSLL